MSQYKEIKMKRVPIFLEQDEVLQTELFIEETSIYKTQKRLYVKKHVKAERTEKVINNESIGSVSVNEIKKKRSSKPLVWGIVIMVLALAFALICIKTEFLGDFNWKLPFGAAATIGVLLLIIGIIVKLPRYYSLVTISSFGAPIELRFDKLKAHHKRAINALAFSTLVKLSDEQVYEAPSAEQGPSFAIEPQPQPQAEPANTEAEQKTV